MQGAEKLEATLTSSEFRLIQGWAEPEALVKICVKLSLSNLQKRRLKEELPALISLIRKSSKSAQAPLPMHGIKRKRSTRRAKNPPRTKNLHLQALILTTPTQNLMLTTMMKRAQRSFSHLLAVFLRRSSPKVATKVRFLESTARLLLTKSHLAKVTR